MPAAILAGITAVTSLFAYFWAPRKMVHGLALANFLLLVATTAIVVVATGAEKSPFLALWMLIGVFSGLFGLWGLGSIFLASHAYLLYLIFLEGMPGNTFLLLFVLTCELPLVVSYLIWHSKSTQESNKDKAFDALAKELSQVANKSEIVINAIADGVIALDGRGTIQLINPAAQTLLGWGKQDATGLDYRSVIKLSNKAGKDVTDDINPIQQVIKTNNPTIDNDLTLTTQSGKQLLVSLVISPVSETVGAGVIVVFRDITSEKAEERQQAEFISTASHEMRTPVAAIEGYLGLALNPATAVIDEKARSFLIKAHESAQHLGHLFQDLLDVSRAEDGRLNSNPTVIDLTAFVRDIVGSLTPKAQEKQLFLHFKPDSDSTNGRTVAPVYYVEADADHLREIVANLVENAIKYTKQGSVSVDVEGDDKRAQVKISDSGIGIPPEDIPHLFQKFYRVDNTDTREIGGTGLGLYLCRRLAESMNGKISVESQYGKGSVFSLELPRVSHEEAMDKLDRQMDEPAIVTSDQPMLASEYQTVDTPVTMQAAPIPEPQFTQAPPQPAAPQQPQYETPVPTEPLQQPAGQIPAQGPRL